MFYEVKFYIKKEKKGKNPKCQTMSKALAYQELEVNQCQLDLAILPAMNFKKSRVKKPGTIPEITKMTTFPEVTNKPLI